MADELELLLAIKRLISTRSYRVRIHAVRHMIEEGFSESDMLEAIAAGKSKLLEYYPDEARCLVVGRFQISENINSTLHVVFDYSNDKVVDIITAYIPQKPWWVTPTKRGKLI